MRNPVRRAFNAYYHNLVRMRDREITSLRAEVERLNRQCEYLSDEAGATRACAENSADEKIDALRALGNDLAEHLDCLRDYVGEGASHMVGAVDAYHAAGKALNRWLACPIRATSNPK